MAKLAATHTVSATFGRTLLEGTLAAEASGQILQSLTLPMGAGGFLTTRTDADTGVATMGSGHGITTLDIVDVHWEGGCRYGMEATVSGDAVTVDGGAGDNLPAESTPLVVTKRIVLVTPFSGDALSQLAFLSDQPCQVVLRDSGGSVLWAQLLHADVPWVYATGGYVANPVEGDDVADLCVSCGSADSDASFQAGVLYDSDS